MNRINDKIEEIELYISELAEIMPDNLDEYLGVKTKAACERYFEKIVEAVIGVAFLILKEKKLKVPDDEKSTFDVLVKAKVITKSLAKKLQDAKGMRNIIAHEYGIVNDELVFHSVSEELIDDVKEFLEQIRK
ncbi:TPA: DUF86 domain-containing protein [Candidatus Woesearchaeota archaeon]|nr:DUF86 domain-containing protein [Candidatus Woesearchaeota archaeon]HIH39536.1 DUF86 domain-containing protein [Candidatus Woesearchaeota archaeon]